jgi:6-pyruvoyl-tetrahydropterin synthase related domain
MLNLGFEVSKAMAGCIRNLFTISRYKKYTADILAVLLLIAISLYLTRFLLDWNNKALFSDLGLSWAWLYWFKESLFTFHQFPTWSPLWMGGMPFWGMVPPGAFVLVLPLYLITGNAPTAYNLAVIIMFLFSGVFMYLYLKHLSRNSLISFLGAVIYMILPVHTSAMMVHGLFEISCGYTVVPLVLLFTERFLERKSGIDLLLLSLSFSFVMLSQIEVGLLLLLFYLPYLIFTMFFKKVGFKSLWGIIKKNKSLVIISLLVFLVPLSFYGTVLCERNNFSGLTAQEIKGGIQFYTLRHFSDAFLAKAANTLDTFNIVATEHYSGPLSFVILLGSFLFLILEKEKRRIAQLLFFLLMGLAFLILSMGVYGPLFPVLRNIIHVLSDMRVAVRFYPFFALCLPILFALSALSFHKLTANTTRIPFRVRSIVNIVIPILLVIGLTIDYFPYFSFYRDRVVSQQDMVNKLSLFLKENIELDESPKGNIARICIYQTGGTCLDRISSIETKGGAQFVIETAQTSLPWNQYKGAVDYVNSSVFNTMLVDEEHLDFYSNLLSIDYILAYVNKIPPIGNEEYVAQQVNTLDELCKNDSSLLLSKGVLDTEYYTVYLYKINRPISQKAQFYPSNESLFIGNSNLYAAQSLFNMYETMANSDPKLTGIDVTNKILAVSGDKNILDNLSQPVVSTSDLFNYGNEVLILPSDQNVAQVIEAGDCTTKGWTTVDRSSWGINASGLDMAVTDVNQATDNYLEKSILTRNDGNWNLNISYLTYVDTGKMQVYVDNLLVGTVDTYGTSLTLENYSTQVFLSAGEHEIKIVGQKSDREITTGSMGDWVEINRIVILNQEALPQIESQSTALWVKIANITAGNNISNQVIAAEDCDSKGWITVDRSSWGINASGLDMAVPDVTQATDNYLKKSILIGNDGNWNINISYLSYVDTGNLEIYVDNKLVGDVDTYGTSLAFENYNTQVFLTAGWHEIKIVGQKSDRNITTGSMGNWIEVEKIVISATKDIVPTASLQTSLSQISNFQLNPQGISLDVKTTEGGVLSVAYYNNPWWRVFVDGKETDVLTINGIYAGCYVPSGQHHIEFVYNYPTLVNLFSLLQR